MKKVELNKDIRIKRDENYVVLKTIRTTIFERINAEYRNELSTLELENDISIKEEKKFFEDLITFFKDIKITDKLCVVTQVGVGSKVLNKYTGYLQKPLGFRETCFNFISDERDNDNRPFTIGFSCLQSVERCK